MGKKIILITGPKHSGKTLTACTLKKIMGGEQLDLDELVEKQTGKKARMLFKEGPEIFKKAEERALVSLIGQTEPELSQLEQKYLIVAAGGGLVDNSGALALLSSHSEIIIVYLEVSAETAWQRILKTAAIDGELPPFLNTENPKETHLALHERRAGSYKVLAHFTIAAENKSPEEIAGEIAKFCRYR